MKYIISLEYIPLTCTSRGIIDRGERQGALLLSDVHPAIFVIENEIDCNEFFKAGGKPGETKKEIKAIFAVIEIPEGLIAQDKIDLVR